VRNCQPPGQMDTHRAQKNMPVSQQPRVLTCDKKYLDHIRSYCRITNPNGASLLVQIQSRAMWHISMSHRIDVTLKYVTRVHNASLQVARAHWLRSSGGRGFTLTMWRNHVVTYLPYGSVPVKCKLLILFNRILVSNATKQMMHDGLVWHANIYVPQLKCQHSGIALVLT